MGVRKNFCGRVYVEILLIFFRLLTMQCTRTFTKRFNLSTSQRKCSMLRQQSQNMRFFGSNIQVQGRNEGVNSPGAESLWGCRITTGGAEWLCGQGRIKGGATGAIAPGPPLQGAPRDEIYLFQIKYSYEKFRNSKGTQEYNSILYSYVLR